MSERYLVKLVRGHVGENLTDTRVEYAPIEDRDEAIKRLRGKLIEEAVEYLLDPSVGELAVIDRAQGVRSSRARYRPDVRGGVGGDGNAVDEASAGGRECDPAGLLRTHRPVLAS